MTRGQERCLYVFPMDEFVRVADAMRAAPMTSKAVRDYLRVFLSGASDEVPDKQGRVTIPAGLREYAGLDPRLHRHRCRRRGSRSGTPPRGPPTSRPPSRRFAEQAEEVIPGLL